MPTWKTTPTRSRTLRISGSFSLTRAGKAGSDPMYDAFGNCIPNSGVLGWGAQATAFVKAPWGNPLDPPRIEIGPQTSSGVGGFRVYVFDGFSSVQSAEFTTPLGSPINWAYTLGGTYEITIDVEEWNATGLPPDTDTIDGSEFPAYEFDAVGDGLEAASIRVFEVAPTGATVTASITVGGTTVSSTSTLSAPHEIENYVAAADIYQRSTNKTMTSVLSVNWDDSALTLPAYDYTRSFNAYGSSRIQVSGGGGVSASIAITGTTTSDACESGKTVNETAEVAFTVAPQKHWRYIGIAKEFEANYLSPLTFRYISGVSGGFEEVSEAALSPSASVDCVQQVYSVASVADGYTNPTISENTFAAARAWLKPASLSDRGEDSRDCRLQLLGFKRDAITVQHAGNFTVDSCSSLTKWSAGSHTTLSLSSGIQGVASGGEGSITWSQASDLGSEAYRYLRLNLKADSPRTVNVTVAGHTWPLEITDTATNYDLDLCMPPDETEEVFTQDSRNLIRGPADTPSDGLMVDEYRFGWGVNRFKTVAISIPDGATVNVATLELRRKNHVKLNLLAGFTDWPQLWDSPTDTTTGQPFWIQETDNRGPFDLRHATHVAPISGSAYYAWQSQQDMRNEIILASGMTATLATDHADGYHTKDLPAYLLGGGGATYDYAATISPWTGWLGIDISGSTVVPSQDLWDQVDVYPGAGEVWTSGDYGGPTEVAFCKHLRSRANGIVGKENGEPFPSADVVLYKHGDTATVYGSALTQADGYYLTGSPLAPGNKDSETELRQGETPYLHERWTTQNRKVGRTSFRQAPSVADSLDYAVSRGWTHARAYKRGTVLHLGFAANSGAFAWDDHETTLEVDSCAISYPMAGDEALWLCYALDGTVYLRSTRTRGATFTVAITIGSGNFGAIAHVANNTVFVYRLSGGTVYGKQFDGQMNQVGTEFTTNLTGLDDKPIAARSSVGSGGELRIGIQHNVGGSLVFKTSRDGKTFS